MLGPQVSLLPRALTLKEGFPTEELNSPMKNICERIPGWHIQLSI